MINLAAAALLAAAAFLLAQVFGNAQQFWFIAVGYYAVFSWACALMTEDRGTFDMTWASPAFMAVVIVYSAVCYIGYSITYWAAPYAERSFSFSKTDLGWLIGAPNALGGFLGVILGGWLADRLQRRFEFGRVMVPAIALLGSIPLLLIGYSTPSSTTFLVCNFLAQVATASALGASAAATQSLVHPRMRGTATAIFLLGATLVGLGFGPFVAGYISESTGSLANGVMSSLVAVVPGVIALGLAIRFYPSAARKLAGG